MKIVDETMWGVAMQVGEEWVPLFEREYWKKINALIDARKHVKRADRQRAALGVPGLAGRNVAVFNFARADFEQVPS